MKKDYSFTINNDQRVRTLTLNTANAEKAKQIIAKRCGVDVSEITLVEK